MSLIYPDLRQAVTLGGVALNNVANTQSGGKTILTGSRVDFMDIGPAEPVQYTEKDALVDGLDYGLVYLGSRPITVRGVSFAATRGQAFDLVSAIEAVAQPVSGTFGLVTLGYFIVTGAGGSSAARSVQVRPNGLQVPVNRDMFGGDNTDAIGIPWAFTAVALNPAIT